MTGFRNSATTSRRISIDSASRLLRCFGSVASLALVCAAMVSILTLLHIFGSDTWSQLAFLLPKSTKFNDGGKESIHVARLRPVIDDGGTDRQITIKNGCRRRCDTGLMQIRDNCRVPAIRLNASISKANNVEVD